MFRSSGSLPPFALLSFNSQLPFSIDFSQRREGHLRASLLLSTPLSWPPPPTHPLILHTVGLNSPSSLLLKPSSSSSSSKAAMPASASPFSDPTLLFYFDPSSDKVTAFRREIEVSRRSKEEAGREGGVMSSTLLLLLPVCSQAHPQLIPCFHSRIRLILPPEAALSHRPTSSNEPRTSSSPRTAPTRTSLFGRFLRLNGS